jgi:hypothetical protein
MLVRTTPSFHLEYKRSILSSLSLSVNTVKSPSVPPPRLTSGKIKALIGDDSDDSDVPLAKKFLKHGRALAGALTLDKEDAPQPPKKRRSKAKAPGPASGPSNTTVNPSTTSEVLKRKEQTVADPPYPPITHGVDSGGRRKVQVLQEKTAPTNTPQKRKKRVRSAKDESEHTQEPRRKKSRRADTATRYARPLFRL